MNKIEYFKINEVFEYKFIQIPKELFFNSLYKDNLDSNSKILYGFLLDRLSLSIKNNWCDENGNVYLIYTREDIGKLLHISNKTVIKAFKQLTECNLIYEKKQGRNKPNLIYPAKIKHDESLNSLMCKNYTSGGVKNTHHEVKNLHPNYTNNNYTKRGNQSSLSYNTDTHSSFDWDLLYDN